MAAAVQVPDLESCNNSLQVFSAETGMQPASLSPFHPWSPSQGVYFQQQHVCPEVLMRTKRPVAAEGAAASHA